MVEPTPTPPQVTPKAEEPVVETPEQLHDAAIVAAEAWKTNPTPETEAAKKSAVEKSKEALKKLSIKEPEVKPKAPEKYDLKLKEGSKLNAAHVEKISKEAKEKGLSQENAQALLDRYHENYSGFTSEVMEEAKKLQDSWLPMSKADPEIGGESFDKNVELAKRVVGRIGSDGFKKFLDETGVGNHPEFIRAFYRLGKMMTEDQLVPPGAPASNSKKSPEEIMYPAQNKT